MLKKSQSTCPPLRLRRHGGQAHTALALDADDAPCGGAAKAIVDGDRKARLVRKCSGEDDVYTFRVQASQRVVEVRCDYLVVALGAEPGDSDDGRSREFILISSDDAHALATRDGVRGIGNDALEYRACRTFGQPELGARRVASGHRTRCRPDSPRRAY